MNADVAAAPELLAALPHTMNIWPWLAVAGILVIFIAISLVGRRRRPHGV